MYYRMYRMKRFWDSLFDWSQETFGPTEVRGPIGPLKHLEKEAKEAYEETDLEKRKEEIADCLFLTFDAAQRAGMNFNELSDMAFAKLDKNKKRPWPDWRTQDPNEAIEHDRSGE